MKKIFVALFALCTFTVGLSAQDYQTAGGLQVDFGNGSTLVGPLLKHFFTSECAGQAEVLFGSGLTVIGVEGSYNQPISEAQGLNWYVGIGPQAYIGSRDTAFGLRPSVGLEYTISNLPVNIGLDWRPIWTLTNGSHFEAGRFGLSFKYIF
jgi:hypothetical protein